jgi:SAM-dependent methyltransferase
MSASELSEHLRHITDKSKIAGYRQALREVTPPGGVVLDLGAGTGLLGLLALEAGASRVYAVEERPILRLAAEVASRNKYVGEYIPVRGLSLDADLPELVDVIVCDQIGGFIYDAGVLEYFCDARRFLRPGGVFVPSAFEARLTPVGGDELARNVEGWSSPAALDFGPFQAIAANSEFRVSAPLNAPLGPDRIISSMVSDDARPFGGTRRLDIDQPGELCGLLGTFVARMSPSVELTNAPWGRRAFDRWQNLYPLPATVAVSRGDFVTVDVHVSPKLRVVRWQGAAHTSRGTQIACFDQSTFFGAILDPDDIMCSNDGWMPEPHDRVSIARRVLDLVDGTKTVGEIATAVVSEFPGKFRSPRRAADFVRSVIPR